MKDSQWVEQDVYVMGKAELSRPGKRCLYLVSTRVLKMRYMYVRGRVQCKLNANYCSRLNAFTEKTDGLSRLGHKTAK